MATKTPGPVVLQRYLDALGGDDPIDAMKKAPARLAKLVEGLTEKQLSKKPAPGKWSIKEIVAHLTDGEVVLGFRYRFVAAHDRPAVPGYDQDAFVERLGVDAARTKELVEDFERLRKANLNLLKRLPEGAFDRVGVHAERGDESIRTMVTLYAGHDRIHLQQIETIRVGLFGGKQKAPAKKKAAAKVKTVPVAKGVKAAKKGAR
ncbi:MAG: DinB family protein [Acidobacteria bacterium]|nr:DinB family protein [Acidobacteriota bacterium]